MHSTQEKKIHLKLFLIQSPSIFQSKQNNTQDRNKANNNIYLIIHLEIKKL